MESVTGHREWHSGLDAVWKGQAPLPTLSIEGLL